MQSWYDEVDKPGYKFANPGFKKGTGHFTQVVWVNTQRVGVALSKDGHFICANYFPAGNMNVPREFEKNVLPKGAKAVLRDPDPLLGKHTVTAWGPDVPLMLAGCPSEKFESMVRAALSEGKQVVIEREPASLKVTVKKPGGGSSTSCMSWG